MRQKLLSIGVFVSAVAMSGTAFADARANKVDTYVRLFNTYTQELERIRTDYEGAFGTLDASATPCASAGREARSLRLSGQDGSFDEFARDLRRGPRLPQDALARDMLAGASTAIPAWDEAVDYYRRNVDSTDACALGNRLHGRLVAAWQQYFAASGPMLTFLREETRASQARELAAIERQYGQNFRYFRLKIITDVVALQELYGAASLDIDAFAALATALEAEATQTRDRAGTAPREVNTALRSFTGWLLQVQNLAGKAADLVAAVRANRNVEHAAALFEHDLSGVIRTSNGMSGFPDVVR